VQRLESFLCRVVLQRRLHDLPVAFLHAATQRIGQRGEHPPAGVVLGHLCEASLAGLLCDRLGVSPDLVPGRRWLVRVETCLLEQRPVVLQPDAVGAGRDAVDVTVGVLPCRQHVRVELRAVGQCLYLLGQVGELVPLDQRLAVGERDGEHGRQRPAGTLRGEGRAGPLILVRLNLDAGVDFFEDLHLVVEGCERSLLTPGLEGYDRQLDLSRLAAGRGLVTTRTARRQHACGDYGRQGRHRCLAQSTHSRSFMMGTNALITAAMRCCR
jgi:hypothetical protein